MNKIQNLNIAAKIFKPGYVDIVMFFKHLSVMIKSGVSLHESLTILGQQSKSGALRKIVQELLREVNSGRMLADALRRHPGVFSEFAISLVQIGEESATLDQNLDYLADYLTKDYKLRKKVGGALLYPGIILTAMIGIGGFITVFVLPQLKEFFDSFDAELPMTTRFMLWFSDLVREHGIIVGLVLFGIILMVSFILHLEKVRPVRDKYLLKVPIFGRLMLQKQLALFARNFGILQKSGVPTVTALTITAHTLTNNKFKQDVAVVASQVNTGKSVADVLGHIKDTPFPPMLIKMLDVGDRTGSLSEVLVYLGEFYEEEVDTIVKNMSELLEPLILILVGSMVGFVAFSIITPIYSVTSNLGI